MILRKNGRFIDYRCLPPIIGPTDIDRRVSFPVWPINKVGDRTTIVVSFLTEFMKNNYKFLSNGAFYNSNTLTFSNFHQHNSIFEVQRSVDPSRF